MAFYRCVPLKYDNPIVAAFKNANFINNQTYGAGSALEIVSLNSRMRMDTFVACECGTFYSLNPALYNICVYQMVDKYLEARDKNQNTSVPWSDKQTILGSNCKYVVISFKKLDGTNFTDYEVNHAYGTVFEYKF